MNKSKVTVKATDVIKRDHLMVEALFEEYKSATEKSREAIEEEIFDTLDTHERMEDEYFYPALEDALKNDQSYAELEEEQEQLKQLVEGVRSIADDRYDRMVDMMEMVLAHAQKEESEIFPRAEEILGQEKLEELGAMMEAESAVANSGEEEVENIVDMTE